MIKIKMSKNFIIQNLFDYEIMKSQREENVRMEYMLKKTSE